MHASSPAPSSKAQAMTPMPTSVMGTPIAMSTIARVRRALASLSRASRDGPGGGRK